MRNRLALVSALIWTQVPTGAEAFVCSRVEDAEGQLGPSVSWFQRNIPFSLVVPGTEDLPGDEEFDELRAAFEPWEQASKVVDGATLRTDIRFTENPLSSSKAVGYNFLSPDNENLLMFHDDAWPHPAQDKLIVALTSTTHNPLTGEILDADIEFNSAEVTFTNFQNTTETDLRNTAVHEVGHLLGLDHSPIQEATMFFSTGNADLAKRDLHEDDICGILFKYPQGGPNGYCVDVVGPDCGFCAPPNELTADLEVSSDDPQDGFSPSCPSAAHTPTTAAALLAALVVLRRRRRL